MIHVDDNDSNNNSTELKELLMEFQSLFGALEIEEDTNAIDILDEDLITSGITDSIRLTHQSKQEKENRTTISKKHSRDDNRSDEIQGSNKRVCNQGNRSRSGTEDDMKSTQNHPRLVVKKIHNQITAEDNPVLYNRLTIKRIGN